jgi:rRNA maturation RNase YbeY
MIEFFSKTGFQLKRKEDYVDWIMRVVVSEGNSVGNITYVFCDDDYLLDVNLRYLDHNTYTDIITFDYSDDVVLGGDIFISIERVKENALEYNEDFNIELLRVMAHGVLHLVGYDDKNEHDQRIMRKKEEEKIKLFHVEQR